MTDTNTQKPMLPSLDDMLAPLLLFEEGEHEFSGAEDSVDQQDIRSHFFPVTRNCVYLNHAALGPIPRPVVQAVQAYIEDTSAYGVVPEAKWFEYEKGAHRRLASMISARPDSIAFTANTGDGLMHMALGLPWQQGDTIISAEGEFPSNIYPWLNLREQGVHLHKVPLRDYRIPTEDALVNITERTRLVSLSLVEFSTGYRNDIAAIARYCHERGILCGIDASDAGAGSARDRRAGAGYRLFGSGLTQMATFAAHNWYTLCLRQLAATIIGFAAWLAERGDTLRFLQPRTALEDRRGPPRVQFVQSAPLLLGWMPRWACSRGIAGGMQAVEARVLGSDRLRHYGTGTARLPGRHTRR